MKHVFKNNIYPYSSRLKNLLTSTFIVTIITFTTIILSLKYKIPPEFGKEKIFYLIIHSGMFFLVTKETISFTMFFNIMTKIRCHQEHELNSLIENFKSPGLNYVVWGVIYILLSQIVFWGDINPEHFDIYKVFIMIQMGLGYLLVILIRSDINDFNQSYVVITKKNCQ